MNKSEKVIEIPDDHPEKFLEMPEGLEGYWWETEKQICVPLVIARNEGDGTFTKWLIELEGKHKLIFFPTIVSARLDRILRERGYVNAFAPDEYFGEVDGLAKPTLQ